MQTRGRRTYDVLVVLLEAFVQLYFELLDNLFQLLLVYPKHLF
jgi:hypothetical protein